MEIGSTLLIVIIAAIVLDVVWKVMAMWVAARKGDKKWFIVLAIVSSLGILPILYYFILSKKGQEQSQVAQTPITGTTAKAKLTSPVKPALKPIVGKV